MKTTLNPFENAKRTAQSTGGSATIPPATSDSIGGVKIGDGINVAEDGTISAIPYTPPAYSTEEVATGSNWIDGKPIYMKTYSFDSKIWIETSQTNIADAPANIDQLLFTSGAIHRDGTSNNSYPICASIGNGKLRGQGFIRTELKMITIWYTKTGA